jgi:putative RNA 2'-phosphotransferase
MTPKDLLSKASKFLSFILRHKPDAVGVILDEQGWTDIDELINKANISEGVCDFNQTLIQDVVESNDKKRFEISADGQRIRAVQGHTINVDLQLKPSIPPDFLYHGTAIRFLDSIMQEGLKPMKRQYVHLSEEVETAGKVGLRYGKPVILTIKANLMVEKGFKFYQAANGVWLTDYVPEMFIAEKI